ncbi:hypothetical protein J6590_100561 [Homalodisca vitripennis]|nr:hypothetical protein J6590_100561 [Homalodisca vitripennis]
MLSFLGHRKLDSLNLVPLGSPLYAIQTVVYAKSRLEHLYSTLATADHTYSTLDSMPHVALDWQSLPERLCSWTPASTVLYRTGHNVMNYSFAVVLCVSESVKDIFRLHACLQDSSLFPHLLITTWPSTTADYG